MLARPCIRPSRWIVVVAMGAVALMAGCGSAAASNAATIDGHHITDGTFRRELRALRGNSGLVEQIEQQGGEVTAGSKDKLNPAITASWLTAVLQQQVIDREFERKHLHVSADAKKQVPELAAQQFGSAKVFDAFPQWFKDLEESRFGRLLTLVGPMPTDAELRAQFEQGSATNCPSGKVVAHILVATKPEADAIELQLLGGADFAAVAGEKSTDTGSAKQGGVLGCYTPGQFVAEFDAVAAALPVDKVSAPVQTEFGWHVIKATPITFESVKAQVEQQARQAQFQKLSTTITKELGKAKISVDPKYGTVQKKPEFRIVPPKQPAAKERPSSSTVAPGADGSGAPGGQSPSSTQPQQTPQPTG